MGLRSRLLPPVRHRARRLMRVPGRRSDSGPLPGRRWSDDARRRLIERLLVDNVLPFWDARVLDVRDGYELHHDARGRWRGPGPRRIVTQARTVWLLSAVARSPYGRPEHLAAASAGFRFLRDRAWDPRHGGVYWELAPDGAVTNPDKHVYAQCFALFAFAEHARAAGGAEALELAEATFDLLERHAVDGSGAWREGFARDWSAAPRALLPDRDSRPGVRHLDTLLHQLESLLLYREVRDDTRITRRLAAGVSLVLDRLTVDAPGRGLDLYSDDWEPLREARRSYGHLLELAWILAQARDVAPDPDRARATAHALVREVLRDGLDHARGGVWWRGPAGGPAEDRTKMWWVQAEALYSCLAMHRETGDEGVLEAADLVLHWIVTAQSDWRVGEWHARVLPDGRTPGDKAGAWKCPYHQVRALLGSLELLTTPATGNVLSR